jgi:hypothetical protein
MVAYLQAWRQIAADFKDRLEKVSDDIYGFFKSKGYSMSKDVFRKALGTVADLAPYMQKECGFARRRSPQFRTGRRHCVRTFGPRPAPDNQSGCLGLALCRPSCWGLPYSQETRYTWQRINAAGYSLLDNGARL